MPLIHMTDMLTAAETCRAPVILSLREAHFEHYDFRLLMAACGAEADVPPMCRRVAAHGGKKMRRSRPDEIET